MATLEEITPSGNIVKLTSPSSFPVTRSLNVLAAGTATMTDEAGNTLTAYPLAAGYNPIKVKAITFGTVTEVWALY